MTSTWFHKPNPRAAPRFLVPGAALLIYGLFRLGPDQLLKLAALEHLHHNIGPADELALHVELGDGGPVGIFLDPVTDVLVLEDVDGFELDPEMVEDRYRPAGKAALREQGRALHEQDHVVRRDDVRDLCPGVHFHPPCGAAVSSCSACNSLPIRPPNAR